MCAGLWVCARLNQCAGVDSPDLPERFAATTPQESISDDEKSPGLLRPVDHAGSDSCINRFNKEVTQGLVRHKFRSTSMSLLVAGKKASGKEASKTRVKQITEKIIS